MVPTFFSPGFRHSLWVRSLTPTPWALVGYIVCSLLIVGIQLLTIITSGRAFAVVVDGYALQADTIALIKPVQGVFDTLVFGNIVSLLVWAAVGWFISLTAVSTINMVAAWRAARHDIAMPQPGVIVPHPVLSSLLVVFLWRLVIGLLAILISLLLAPIIGYCFNNTVSAVNASTVFEALYLAASAVLLWTLILHTYVVLLRLYVRRTRVFEQANNSY
jgi:hypothetical protein